MTYKENTPTFSGSERRVANFSDYCQNWEAEKGKLKKTLRSFMPNSDRQNFPRNSRTEYDPATHKLTDFTEDEIEDKLDRMEEIEEETK